MAGIKAVILHLAPEQRSLNQHKRIWSVLRRFWSTFKAQISLFSATYWISKLCFLSLLSCRLPRVSNTVTAVASACFTSVTHTERNTRDCDPRPPSDWSAAPTHTKKRGSYSLTWPPTPVTSRPSQPPKCRSDMWAFRFKSSWLTENWSTLPPLPPPSPSCFLPVSIVVNEPVHRERCSSCLSHSCSPIKRNEDREEGAGQGGENKVRKTICTMLSTNFSRN